MCNYINKDGLLNEGFFTPICDKDFNKNFDEKSFLQWYVITNNTSWANIERALVSGPYITRKEAMIHCNDLSCWPELMSAEEAKAITY